MQKMVILSLSQDIAIDQEIYSGTIAIMKVAGSQPCILELFGEVILDDCEGREMKGWDIQTF